MAIFAPKQTVDFYHNQDTPVYVCFLDTKMASAFNGIQLSMAFSCVNGISKGGQLSPLLYNAYTDDLNHHLQATGVGCYVGGACVIDLEFAYAKLQFYLETEY